MAGELRGWKEIAAYLGVTDRTAQRWEVELNLPVHRVRQHGSSPVFATTDELDTWRRTADGARAAEEQTPPPPGGRQEKAEEGAASPSRVAPSAAPRRAVVLIVAFAVVLACAAVLVFLLGRPRAASPAPVASRTAERPVASGVEYFSTSAESPFVITTEIVGTDEVKFRARSHGGQAIHITLASGTEYGLALSQLAPSRVRAHVVLATRGGHGTKVLETAELAKGDSYTFTRGADSFRFQWISSEPVPPNAPWASRQLQGCGMSCANPKQQLGKPAVTVVSDEVSSDCGACCDPDFGACSLRKRRP